jgi:oligoribonuclease NrnB/cAMP/cGMP phosphodiesterase (DHH superfamily)
MENGTLVLYHDSCNDGFCAAWLWRKYATWSNDAEYRAVQYGQPAPTREEIRGRHVVILDFSYSREELERIKDDSAGLLVLDHHKTAEEALRGLPYCHFNMEKSGARLTWEYLGAICGFQGYPSPALVDYTEDRDLWRHLLPNSAAVNAAIFSYPRTFGIWDLLEEKGPGGLSQEGIAILRYQDGLIAPKVDKKKVLYSEIGGYLVPVVNATCLISEIAGTLAEGEPFATCFFLISDREVVYSLRSRGTQAVDVAEVAKKYGGGGHKNAAGFTADHILEMKPVTELEQ